MSKRSQIRELTAAGIKRSRIATIVGCSYQYVRNEQDMMEHELLLPFMRDPESSDVTECTVHYPSRPFGLWEETWRPS